ncbi:hypothetical protein ABW636_12470 [Aquimarina sp. 2201CG1-2-11]|uniref:hypothetical protein n=1 Tax=Aquimarina discodermiae TaxID=3231043 RepID=UPI003461AB5E
METRQNTSDEVDLGQLFEQVGKALNKFFRSIEYFFKRIFNVIMLFLKFLRTHFLKFILATIIGAIFGAYLDSKSLPIYRSSMIIEPNFNSAQQLYNNIEFYNQLAKQEETKALAEAFMISDEEAKHIKNIRIESFSDQTQRIKQFSEFISELDSISQKQVDYKDYLENFNNINAKFHKIEIEASNPEIARKCQKTIVTSIEYNEYFTLQKEINDRNIAVKDSIIIQQQKEIMGLQEFYKKLKILEAQKPDGRTTSISLAENQTENAVEIELLRQARELKDEKVEINNEKANTKNTINVISEFPFRGALVNDFLRKKIIVMPLVLIVLLFFILALIELNKFIINYNHKKIVI